MIIQAWRRRKKHNLFQIRSYTMKGAKTMDIGGYSIRGRGLIDMGWYESFLSWLRGGALKSTRAMSHYAQLGSEMPWWCRSRITSSPLSCRMERWKIVFLGWSTGARNEYKIVNPTGTLYLCLSSSRSLLVPFVLRYKPLNEQHQSNAYFIRINSRLEQAWATRL